MRLDEIRKKPIQNPFPGSKLPVPLYHGTDSKFDKFLRPVHGIYATPSRWWAKEHYGNTVVIIYANVKKIKDLNRTVPEDRMAIDAFYDRDYSAVAEFLKKLSAEGYDCCMFGGESESVVLFNDIQIVNAFTGTPM